MKIKHTFLGLLLFGILCIPIGVYAQDKTPTDDLGNISDDFQENFFEALKQKGIENYELALNALDKAEVAAKDNQENKAVVYFEKFLNDGISILPKNINKYNRIELTKSISNIIKNL